MKLFVGSLPYEFSDEDLRELFADFGEVVSAKVILDRETGRSRGFGFVELSSNSEGTEAIDSLNESNVGGRSIVVKQAHDRQRERTRH
ncbi:MAG: RNA recognition motif-containing protein [Chlamydiales bacterium]|jgi:RNA recognition motif-containing protein